MLLPQSGLMRVASGGFNVPGAMPAADLPPEVKLAMLRPIDAPPKPAVTLAVMNETQRTMIAPDLPYKGNV